MNARAMRSLLAVQFLAGLNLNALRLPKKRVRAWLATVGMTVLLAPSYIGVAVLQVKAFGFVRDIGLPLEDMLLVGMYAASLFMILFAGIPTVYASLYQSKELSVLLPLPFSPWQIVAAKLASIYAVELLVGWAFFLPALAAYFAYGHASVWHLPIAAIGLLLMPVVPLALSAMLCMLVSNIPGVGRNKWFWYIGITVALLGATLMLTTGMIAEDTAAMADLIEVRMRQIAQIGRMLPGAQFGMYALVDDRWTAILHQAANIVVSAGYALAVLGVGSAMYIGPIMRGDGVRQRGRTRTGTATERGILASFVRKELICTLKDPAVAMNGLGGYIALPMLGVTYTLIKVQSKGKVDILGQLDAMLHSEQMAAHLPYFVVAIALGLTLFGSLSSLFAASYSKDGKRLWVEQSLPVAPFTVYIGKLAAGYGLVTLLNLTTLALATLVVPFRPHHWLYVAGLSQIAIVWNAAFALAIDSTRPKLVWKDSVQAVKQNMNVVLAMGVSFAGLGLNAGILKFLWDAQAGPPVVYTTAAALNVVLAGIALAMGRAASNRLARIQV